jgi:hypothetical protein
METMTNRQMDEKIRDAFEAATPNVLGSILAQCAKQKRNITVFKQRRSIGWTRRFITVSAVSRCSTPSVWLAVA